MKRLLAADPSDEAQAQQILLDRLERAFAGRVEAEIAAASRAMLDEYRATGADPAVPMMHHSRMTQLYADMAGIAAQAFGERVLDAAEKRRRLQFTEDGKGFTVGLETKSFEEFFQTLTQFFVGLEAIRQRIALVSEHTRTQIIDAIQRGLNEGLGAEAIAKQISDRLPAIARVRARVIARTETHAAANYASHEAANSVGLEMRKEWISVEDHRTRDFGPSDGVVDEYDHRSMNGQTVGMDQPFMMPWAKGDPIPIMYPGEAGQPPGAVINCRCVVGYIVAD